MSISKRVMMIYGAFLFSFLGGCLFIRSRIQAPETLSLLQPQLVQIMSLTLCLIGLSFVLVLDSYKKFFRKIILELDQLAGQLDGSSYEIKSKGHLVLKGAQRQTAAIKKTTQSHRQLVEQIQMNARDLQTANNLILLNMKQIETANKTLERLILSMEEIKQAGGNIHKITDDINEIASQTHLLAINAGVESARAGIAGKAFSIIAEEVRRLALRTGTSARKTTELIESTIGKVEAGSATANEMVYNFRQMSEHFATIKSQMVQLGRAAEDQVADIRQMETSVSELGLLAEENAANAGDTNDISTKLQTNGEKLRIFISDIIAQTLTTAKSSPVNLNGILSDFKQIGNRLNALDSDTKTAHEDILLQWQRHHPRLISAVYSADSDGSFIFSYPPAGISNARIRPWWQRAMTGEQYVSPIYISAIDNKPCRTISLAFLDRNDRVRGVIGADLTVG